MTYYWLSANLYIGTDGKFYRIDCRQVGQRTWVRDVPVRIEKKDIRKRGDENDKV